MEDEIKLEKNKRLDEVNERIDFFKDKENRDKWVSDRKNLLQQKIDKRPDKEPVHPGNITMKQHLQNLYKKFDEEPEKVIDRIVNRLEQSKESLEVELSASRDR